MSLKGTVKAANVCAESFPQSKFQTSEHCENCSPLFTPCLEFDTGFATKTVSQGAPLPTEHSKITILHGIGCSLNLSISYCCSFAFWEYLCGLLSMGKQSIGKLCHMSGHPLLQKARTFGLGPPAPPSNKHNRFQYTVPSHTKSCMAHSGGRGVRGKKPGFL